jgi:glycosyltransferase involved in cell wall biosynthesis
VRLLKDADLRKQFGEAGRARVAEHFGVDRLVEGTLDAYRKIAGR